MVTKRGQLVPLDIATAIRSNRTALTGFEHMPPAGSHKIHPDFMGALSHQHEYLSYILEAKLPDTRLRRIQQSIAMMAKWERQHAKRHRPKK